MSQRINPTHVESLPTFVEDEKNVVHAVIETPRDQRHKYAFVPKFGLFRQKLLLPEGLQWPYDYGFIPSTLADDGDPLDVLYLGAEPTFTGCLVHAYVIGIVSLKKNGVENDRILARPVGQKGLTLDTDAYDDVDDVPSDTMRNVCRYLVEYSESEGNEIEFKGTQSRKRAIRAVKDASKTFKKSQR